MCWASFSRVVLNRLALWHSACLLCPVKYLPSPRVVTSLGICGGICGGSRTRHAERSKAFRSPLRGLVGVCLAARALKRVPARARARHGARACGENGVELCERAEPPKPRYYTERRPERTPMRGVFSVLLMGKTPPRRSRVRAAADVAAANSGPIGTHRLLSGEEMHRSSKEARTAPPLPSSPTLCR